MHRIALILAALALIAAVGCADDDEALPATPTATPAEPAPTPAPDPTPTAPGDEEAAGAFEDLFQGFPAAEFTVTFLMETADLETPIGGGFSGEWTWYQAAGAERTRFDFSGEVAGFEGAMTVITTPDETFICVGGACLAAPEGVPLHGNPGEAFADQVTGVEERATGTVRDAGTRTIAGVEAHCFEFEQTDAAAAGGGEGTVCLSPEGVPLFSEFQSPEGTFRLEATSYSDSVSDEDFEPPYPVTRMPG